MGFLTFKRPHPEVHRYLADKSMSRYAQCQKALDEHKQSAIVQ